MSGVKTSVIDLPLEEHLFLEGVVTFSGRDTQGRYYSRIVGIDDYDKSEVKPEDVLTIYPMQNLPLASRVRMQGSVIKNGHKQFDHMGVEILEQIEKIGMKMVSDANPLLKYSTQTGTV